MGAVVALTLVAACGGNGGGSGTSSLPKIGVVLTYNLPGFWGNYLSYESQYETQRRRSRSRTSTA